jgi:hypothetical protein
MADRFRVKNLLLFAVGLVSFFPSYASELPSLSCDFYPIESSSDKTPNVRLTRGWLGMGEQKVEIDPKRKGSWNETVTVSASDHQVSYKDGWGLKNSKDCEALRFNALDHCPTLKIIEKEIVTGRSDEGEIVMTKQWFETDCCYQGRHFRAGDLASKGSCVLVKSPD